MDILTQKFWNAQKNLNVCWTDSDKRLLELLAKFIDLEATVERLRDLNCQNCLVFTDEHITFAFVKWFESKIESIEQQPEWYIKNEPKVFNQNLPFDQLEELMCADDLREYDPEELDDDFDDPEQIAIQSIYDW